MSICFESAQPTKLFSCLEVHRTENSVRLSQDKYIFDLLKCTCTDNCKETSRLMSTVLKLSTTRVKQFSDPTIYCNIVGALSFVTITRP